MFIASQVTNDACNEMAASPALLMIKYIATRAPLNFIVLIEIRARISDYIT